MEIKNYWATFKELYFLKLPDLMSDAILQFTFFGIYQYICSFNIQTLIEQQ